MKRSLNVCHLPSVVSFAVLRASEGHSALSLSLFLFPFPRPPCRWESFHWRCRDDGWEEELRFLVVVESVLVFHQSRHPCGEPGLASWFSAHKRSVLHSGLCSGDPALVHHHLCAPHLWKDPVSSVGPGSGLVYGCSGPPLDPRRGCVQAEASRGTLLEGGHGLNKESFIDVFRAATLTLPRFLQRLKTLCSPSDKWHPHLDVNRGERYSVERCSSRRPEPANNKTKASEI